MHPVIVTTRIVSCLVGDSELNLHLPLLLGRGTTQHITHVSFSHAFQRPLSIEPTARPLTSLSLIGAPKRAFWTDWTASKTLLVDQSPKERPENLVVKQRTEGINISIHHYVLNLFFNML